jgi:tetratricopeptide (TPR) repeat protein
MTRSAALQIAAMHRVVTVVFTAAAVAILATTEQPAVADPPEQPAVRFEGMGTHGRKVTTNSAEAQAFFNQGLVWTFAFNHDEAIRSFREAARLDPNCAMAHWGIALCNGPHINNPIMDEARSKAAWEALQKARELASKASPVERQLIDALSSRYAEQPPDDRKPLDEAYAAAMHKVWEAHKNDADIGTLYAEALMDLRPWDLWTQDGDPRPGTERIVALLEHVMELQADHPGALHLYIHAVEASRRPERAIAAADRLRELVPASGHLVHMPSHIYVRTGRWADAALANERAIAADDKYRELSPNQGFYRLYMAHDHHFLSYVSMMEGRQEAAVRAAREMVAGVPPAFIETHAAIIDPYAPIVLQALMRFGRWDDILREPAPPEALPITAAMWRFSRGVAHAAKGEVEAADRERQAFRALVANLPKETMAVINPAHSVLDVAALVLDGEVAFRRGRIDESVEKLRQAAKLEDALLYMEPPEWMQPARHTLGAVLTTAGRHREAAEVYRDDLRRYPENGWSLYGLARNLDAAGDKEDAAAVRARFDKAWSRADTPIDTSCLCIPGGKP